MNLSKCKRIVLSLAIGGLLLTGFFLFQNGTLHAAPATSRRWFVKPDGRGNACTQIQPCALDYTLSRATDGDTVYVAQGTYVGTGGAVVTVTRSITLYGGWDGAAFGFVVRNPISYPTTLDGEYARRVVYISGNVAPTIDGFIIAHGNASSVVNPGYGGGIYASYASPTITNNVITNNVACASSVAWGRGGGIYLGYYAVIPALISGNVIISNTANGAGSGRGGGLHVELMSPVTIRDNTFQDNIAGCGTYGMGGGLYLYLHGSYATVSDNRIEHNKATESGGGSGGGFHSEYGRVTLEGNMIFSNAAQYGAVAFERSADVTMTNNVVAQNAGGGVFVRGDASFPFGGTMVHNTIVQNGGAGIYVGYNYSGHAALTLINTIIVSHTTGIYCYSDPDDSNAVTATHTLIYGNTFNADGSHIICTSQITGSDPLFVNPAGWDYHIAGNSPAVDRGTAVFWVATDMDGEARPSGPGYDVGADEVQWKPVYLPLVMRIGNRWLKGGFQ